MTRSLLRDAVPMDGSKVRTWFVATALAALFTASVASAAGQNPPPPTLTFEKASSEQCQALDDPEKRGIMDGLLHYLYYACGREHELVQPPTAPFVPQNELEATDVRVSDPTGDTGSFTQSETSISYNPVTGTLCAAYNDSFHGITPPTNGFSGFSRSVDGGATWTDRGAIGAPNSGDPSLVWRKADGKFYYAALSNGGLAVFKSNDDCTTFTFVASIASGSDDKEIMAVDNNEASPHYGNLYVVWTDFGNGNRIFATRSTNLGVTWSAQVPLSAAGAAVQGAWPAVASNGDVYAMWLRFNPFPSGPIDVEGARSTDGGVTWTPITNALTAGVSPQEAAATGTCGRPAIKGPIRILPSPQIAVGPGGVLHVVYARDPDTANSGDVISVYYRRSTDNGATWGTEVLINDDGTTTDQYFPSLAVSDANIVNVAYYSKQNDTANNLMQDYYSRTSFDGGVTWSAPSVRLSDVSSPIVLDNGLAACYHGDYDQQVIGGGFANIQWSDDRSGSMDTWFDLVPAGTDFLVAASPASLSVCRPNDGVYNVNVLQFQAFAEPVTLSTTGQPAGSTVTFGTNPVNPGNGTTMTIGTAGASAGASTITITGTSSPSNIVHSTTVDLDLFTAAPSQVVLTSPGTGATNVPPATTFSWAAATQAETYTLEVATDLAFTNIVVTQANLTNPTFTLAAPLITNTLYFWRVRSINACGTGTDSIIFNFRTQAAPGDCAIGSVPTSIFTEGFESGAAGWVSSGTGNTWAQSSARIHSGSFAWKSAGAAVVTDQRLDSPAIALPTAQGPLTLQFWNHQTIEDATGGCFDGAVIEISTDNGTTWTRLEAQIVVDPYNGPVSTQFQNPLAGTNAWCGDPQDWTKAIADVSAFAGQSVKFRFRHATDNSVSREGWYIDDVVVQTCNSDVFRDGFNSGNTSAWTATVP